MKDKFKWLYDKAVEIGEIGEYKYFIVPAPMEGALNGYIMFDKKPVKECGYSGIISYVPVHGGITYCEHDENCSVYGFDTLHYNSEQFPRTDTNWIKQQIEIMLNGIIKAAEVETKYLKCVSNKGKAKYCQMVSDIAPETEYNFGVMINLLSGKL